MSYFVQKDKTTHLGTRAHTRGLFRLLAWAVICLAVILPHLAVLNLPLDRDEGAYAYIATRILQGDIPYRDAWDHKPPGIHYLYALAFLAFGVSEASIRILALLWGLASTIAFFVLVRDLFKPVNPYAATLLYALASGSPGVEGPLANTEPFLLLPLALAIKLASTVQYRRLWLLLSGSALGAAIMIKPVAALFLPILFVPIAFGGGRAKSKLLSMLLVIVGCVAVVGLVITYFAHQGALPQLKSDVWSFNRTYANHPLDQAYLRHWSNSLQSLARYLLPLLLLAVVGILGLATRFLGKLESWVLGLWLSSATAATMLGGEFFRHYYILVLAPVCILASYGLVYLSRPRIRLSAILFVFLWVGWASSALLADGKAISNALFEGPVFVEGRDVGLWIREQTTPQDQIYVWGSEPEVYFYARRLTGTRYMSSYPITGGDHGGAYPEAEQDVLRTLKSGSPRFVVVMKAYSLIPSIKTAIDLHYQLVRETSNFQIWLSSRHTMSAGQTSRLCS